MAMLRHRANIGAINSTALIFSVRTEEDVIYRKELMQMANKNMDFNLFLTFTRQAPIGWTGYRKRIDRDMLIEVLKKFNTLPLSFICGPTLLVEQVANSLVDIGLPADIIRTERFGPTSA
jgi:ferredoxin-NADP reductase